MHRAQRSGFLRDGGVPDCAERTGNAALERGVAELAARGARHQAEDAATGPLRETPIGVVLVALGVFRRSSRRVVRAVAGSFVLVGLVAAVMAPIVKTESDNDSDEPLMMR
jgi:hypothetical protein